jgi:beta-lactamase regulating signal transducer with metallopeptidase domain
MTTHECLDTIWRSTLAGSGAIVLVLLLRAGVRRWLGAQAAYLLWALVPAAALAILWPAPVRIVAAVVQSAAAPSAHAPGAATLPVIVFDAQPILLYVWILGAAAMLLWFVLQQRSYLASLGRLAPDANGIVHAEADSGCPALIGALRPRIVVPRDFESRFELPERQLILAHERVHLRRGDAQMNALVVILRCLNWFNPLVHFAASRFRLDQELACDAVVMSRFPAARRPYASAMLKAQLVDIKLPVGCLWQSGHPLTERIAMLKRPLPGRARAVSGLLTVAALLLGGSYGAWAVQPAVTRAQAENSGTMVTLNFRLRTDGDEAPAKASHIVFTPVAEPSVGFGDNDEWSANVRVSPEANGRVVLSGYVKVADGQTVSWIEAEVIPGRPFEMSNFVASIGHTLTLSGNLTLKEASVDCTAPPQDQNAALTAFETDIDSLKGDDKLMSIGTGQRMGEGIVMSSDLSGAGGNTRILSEDGKGFRISMGTRANPRTVDVIPHERDDGLMMVEFIVMRGDEIQGHPSVLVNENQQAEILISGVNGVPPLDVVFSVAHATASELIPDFCNDSLGRNQSKATL